MATCFDSTVWFSRCSAKDVITELTEELGAVLSERDLLAFLQEAVGEGGDATGRAQQPQQPQRAHRAASASRPFPPSELPSQSQQQSQQPLLSQRSNGGLGNGNKLGRQTSQQQPLEQQPVEQKPAVCLILPSPSAGATPHGLDPAMGVGGAVDTGAALKVQLPPGRFGGCEVFVRLPPLPGRMELVEGEEAQRACMTLVSNLHQQLSERREQLERVAAELARAVEENAQLRNQLLAGGGGGGGGGGGSGPTPWQQYGLAGAPPPLSGAAAKRQRTAPPAQLQQLLAGGLEGNGGAAAGPAAPGAAAGAAARGFASQPAPVALPLSQLAPQGSQAPTASQAGGNGRGCAAGSVAGSPSQREQSLPAARSAPTLLPGPPGRGVGAGAGAGREAGAAPSAGLGGSQARPPCAVTTVSAAVASMAVVGAGGGTTTALAAGVTSTASIRTDRSNTSAAAGPVGRQDPGEQPFGTDRTYVVKEEPGWAVAGGAGPGNASSAGASGDGGQLLPAQSQPQQQQPALGAAGGAVGGVSRDPSRVGISIRTTGQAGRGPFRGGRSGLRR